MTGTFTLREIAHSCLRSDRPNARQIMLEKLDEIDTLIECYQNLKARHGEAVRFLEAVAEGYKVETYDGRYVSVENPEADDGFPGDNDPYIVIDTYKFQNPDFKEDEDDE